MRYDIDKLTPTAFYMTNTNTSYPSGAAYVSFSEWEGDTQITARLLCNDPDNPDYIDVTVSNTDSAVYPQYSGTTVDGGAMPEIETIHSIVSISPTYDDTYYFTDEDGAPWGATGAVGVTYPNDMVFERSQNKVINNGSVAGLSVVLRNTETYETVAAVARTHGNIVVIDDLIAIDRVSEESLEYFVTVGDNSGAFKISHIMDGRGKYEWGQQMEGGWLYPQPVLVVPVDGVTLTGSAQIVSDGRYIQERFFYGQHMTLDLSVGILDPLGSVKVTATNLRYETFTIEAYNGDTHTLTVIPVPICSTDQMVYWLDRYGIEQSYPFKTEKTAITGKTDSSYTKLNDDLTTEDVFNPSTAVTLTLNSGLVSKMVFDHCCSILSASKVWIFDTENIEGESRAIICKVTGTASHSERVPNEMTCSLTYEEEL